MYNQLSAAGIPLTVGRVRAIKRLIAEGKITEAFELTRDLIMSEAPYLENEFVKLSDRWEDFRRKNRAGILSHSETVKEREKIVADLVNLFEQIKPPIRFLISLINRQQQDVKIKKKSDGKNIISILIHAHANHKPDLYFDRLCYKLGEILKIEKLSKKFIRYNFPIYNNDQDIEEEIFSILEEDNEIIPGKNVIDSIRSKHAGATIFYTEFHQEGQTYHVYEKMLKSYAQLWRKQPDYGPQKPLIVILLLSYPSENWIYDRLLKRGTYTNLRKCISILSFSDSELIILPELSDITKHDVNFWFSSNIFKESYRIDQYTVPLKKSMAKIFRTSNSVPLYKIYNIADKIIK